MSRLSVWRGFCLLAIIGGILQSVGFFFPYALMINVVTGATLESESYWSALARGITRGSGLALVSSLIALVLIVAPLVIACIEFFRRPQRWSSLTCISIGMGLAILGLLEHGFLALGATFLY